jgi:hypothetical protein
MWYLTSGFAESPEVYCNHTSEFPITRDESQHRSHNSGSTLTIWDIFVGSGNANALCRFWIELNGSSLRYDVSGGAECMGYGDVFRCPPVLRKVIF